MSIARGWPRLHEVNASFELGSCCDEWMDRSQWGSSFGGVNLEICAMFDGVDVVVEECRTKVTGPNDFMGSIHSREMPTIRANMEIVEHSLSLFMYKATMKYYVHSLLV